MLQGNMIAGRPGVNWCSPGQVIDLYGLWLTWAAQQAKQSQDVYDPVVQCRLVKDHIAQLSDPQGVLICWPPGILAGIPVVSQVNSSRAMRLPDKCLHFFESPQHKEAGWCWRVKLGNTHGQRDILNWGSPSIWAMVGRPAMYLQASSLPLRYPPPLGLSACLQCSLFFLHLSARSLKRKEEQGLEWGGKQMQLQMSPGAAHQQKSWRSPNRDTLWEGVKKQLP